jgi:hypothetical protein
MNKRLFSYLFLFVYLLLVSCHKNSGKNICNIEYISARYYTGVFETPVAITRQNLENEIPYRDSVGIPPNIQTVNGVDRIVGKWRHYPRVAEAIITNRKILYKIEQALYNLSTIHAKYKRSEDVRIICTIVYRNGKRKYLSFNGEYAGGIYYEGLMYFKDNNLNYLMKKNMGYYKWMDEQDFYFFPELHDSCFNDTIIDFNGNIYWRNKYLNELEHIRQDKHQI